jgi:hypothetical protein
MASPIRGFKIAAGMRIKMSQKNSKPEVSFAIDAWSQGQVRSKMWLLETLEPLARNDRHSQIWILGGWYGLLAFMLFTRNQIQPHLVTSFDIDPDANKKAEVLNNSWAFDPIRFTAKTADCMKLDFQLNKPDVVINTSCEHFPSSWSEALPAGILVALQSTDMPHSEHVFGVKSLKEFLSQYDIFSQVLYSGEMHFKYPDLEFSRFMIIGKT